jgi:hypothetical protein
MNKTIPFILILIVLYTSIVYGKDQSCDEISKIWLYGNKIDVLNIANKRLQKTPNDIVGLLIKMEYELAFLQLDQAKDTIDKIIVVGTTIKTKNFSKNYTKFKNEILFIKDSMNNYPKDKFIADKKKGNIKGKPFPHMYILMALQEDGFFD